MSELEWNVRAPGQPGGIDLLLLSVRSFRGDVRQATPDDLIACLRANASACGEVMAAMGWVTDQALAVTGERAEQAERERDEARAKLAEAERSEAEKRAQRNGGQDGTLRLVAENNRLVSRIAKAEAVVEAALKHLEATRWDPQPSKHWKLSREGLNHSHVCDAMDALRALDSSVGVAATAEPAGSWTGDRVWEHHEPATQDPATRAEVEELRRRVDRLESLTDNEE